MARRMSTSVLVLCLAVGVAAGGDGAIRKGTYSLKRVDESARPLTNHPSCGDEASRAFRRVPTLEVAYKGSRESALVNDERWIMVEGRTTMAATKQLTRCASFALMLSTQDKTATGTLVYVSKCPDGTIHCGDAVDFAGTYTAP